MDFMRILFAEDDRDLSRAVKALLEHAGYSVDVVYNGNDALEYAEGGNYDGMILDWMMPGRAACRCWNSCAGSSLPRPA